MGVAWLITHDEHVDRRIFFFADVLGELGYNVSLFCSYRNETFNDEDHNYIRRPEKETLVRDYKNLAYFSNVNEIPEIELREIFVRIISLQQK
ncbi:hypothetical protein, partial [Acinetobacter baumannii]|uniref:hypothetical protein n=1 Tax=Acinetobacter baumannii TaxID=470 RepID=UPI000ADAE402